MMARHRFHPPEPTGPERPPARTPEPPGGTAARPGAPLPDAAEIEARLAAWESEAAGFARAGRRTMRAKLAAGLSGLKHAVRGDSSFFAHAYRGLLIGLIAAILGVGPIGWCLLVLSAALVFVAELAHSAIDTLARALGDPEEPGLRVAREIATAGVLVAVTVFAAMSITVLVFKLGETLGWWS